MLIQQGYFVVNKKPKSTHNCNKNTTFNKIKKKLKEIARTKFDIEKIRNNIKKQIANPELKYVSFDIFDMLLVRPCLQPTDIFAFIAEKVNSKYQIDFFSMRITAENGLENPNIYEIYKAMAVRHNLSEELTNILLTEEINAETQFLTPREDVIEFYNLALSNNKKIIAISDMYLPSNILEKILKAKGFDKIEKIYVSNEYQARKDNGKLFDIVLDELKTKNILHIGDNKHSDYQIPKNKKINAIYYPKVIDILAGNCSSFYKLNKTLCNCDFDKEATLNKNVFIGFVLNNYWFNKTCKTSPHMLNSIEDFVNLFLAPYLCYISLSLQKNTLLQNLYKKIFFVARDGYLPNKIYNLLNTGKYLPSEYLYASRLAYWTGSYASIQELLIKQKIYFSEDYTFEDFINAYIIDDETNKYLKTKYTKDELNICIRHNVEICTNLLSKEQEVFEKYYNNQKSLAKEYYSNLFEKEKDRIVIFDIGYGGSISVGLQKLTTKTIDKIYIHETPQNIYRDNKNKTYTFILKNGIESAMYKNLDLLLEECFSPLEGSCCGFERENNKIVPVLGKMHDSLKMKISHQKLNEAAETFTKNLINVFGEYIDYLNVTDINPLFNCISKNFRHNPKEKNIFKDFIFNDTVTKHRQVPLCEKI